MKSFPLFFFFFFLDWEGGGGGIDIFHRAKNLLIFVF